MRITLTRAITEGGYPHAMGETLDVHEAVAQRFIAVGAATLEQAEEESVETAVDLTAAAPIEDAKRRTKPRRRKS